MIGRCVLGWRAGDVYDQSLARFPVTNATENTEEMLVQCLSTIYDTGSTLYKH